MNEEYLTLNEAAKLSKYSAVTLRYAARKGHLKAVKRGRDWFVTVSELRRWEQDEDAHKHDPDRKTRDT